MSITLSSPLKRSFLLESQRLVLRVVETTDANLKYLGWLNDPAVNEFLETRFEVQSIEKILSFIDWALESSQEILLAMVLKDKKIHIGNIKIGSINFNHYSAELSYFIGERNLWGKGYATEAICACVKFAFETLQLQKLQAGCYESNLGSQRALEKSGFVLEGRLRAKIVGANGVRQSHLWYGIKSEDVGVKLPNLRA